MGIIRRQSIKNSAFNYVGVALGYINMAILMTALLSTEEYGLRGVIYRLGALFSVLSLAGSPNIMNRFFPAFRNPEKGHGGLFRFVLTYNLYGIGLLTLVYLGLREFIQTEYADNPLLIEYFYLVIPFGASLSFFESLSSYCRVLLKTTIPVFIKELLVRVFTTLLLGGLYFGWIDFSLFLPLHLFSYLGGALLIIIYLIRIGEFSLLGVDKRFFSFPRVKEIVSFGLFSAINASMNLVVRAVDVMMLTRYFRLGAAGIYDFGTLIANVILIPALSLRQIASPIISRAFEDNDMEAIKDIYIKTTIVQLIPGIFVYSLVMLNLDIVLNLLSNKDYLGSYFTVLFIGLARLFEMASGMNNRIIME